MDSKVAFITGGSKGIGAAAARKLAKKGCRVAVTYLGSKADALSLVKELNADAAGGELKAIALKCDVRSVYDITSAIRETKSVFGRIDILINSAGVSLVKLLADSSDSEINNVISTNLTAAILTSRAALPYLLESSGCIVNISSVWGVCGAAMESVYSASKAGLIGFTKALSKELSMSGVRVNAVSPGMVDTAMNSCFSAEEKEAIKAEIPLGRAADAREIAEAVSFLIDNEYITGENLNINGGFGL